jgi:hypothetical protein
MVDLVAAAAGVLWAHVSLVPAKSHRTPFLGSRGTVRDIAWDRLRDGVSTTSGGLAARAAVPDTDGLTLDSVLTAELAHVAGVLCDLGDCQQSILWALQESRCVRTSIFLTCLRSEAP